MNKLKLGVFSLSTLLLLAACGDTSTPNNITPTPNEPETAESTNSEAGDTTTETKTPANSTTETPAKNGNGIQEREFEISLEDAVQIFNDTFPDAEGIDNVHFDVDDGRFEYEIDGFNSGTEFELTIDAETGDILEQETNSDDDDDEKAIDFANIILPQEAMKNALAEAGSGYVKEWELDTDDGRTYYDIDLEDADNDVDDAEVDAITGDVRLDD